MQNLIDILAIIKPEDAQRYVENLGRHPDFNIERADDAQTVRAVLVNPNTHVDVLIIDNRLPDVHSLIGELRSGYPRMLIILVDEDADFGLPGQADDISTDPFEND